MNFKDFLEKIKKHLKKINVKSPMKLGGDFFMKKEKQKEVEVKKETKPLKSEEGNGVIKEEVKKEDKDKKVEKKEEPKKNIKKKTSKFNDIFWSDSKDIFKPILEKKEERVLNITWKEEPLKLSLYSKEEEEEEEEKDNLENLIKGLWYLNNTLLAMLSFVITASIWLTIFYYITMDEENRIFEKYSHTTIWLEQKKSKDALAEKEEQKEKIKKAIEGLIWWIPEIIYTDTPEFKKLSEKTQKDLFFFYSKETWILDELNEKKRSRLERFYKKNSELYSLKATFDKEHVLNDVNRNKIYWKKVYKDLKQATNNEFEYNEILNYIQYDNFSVDEKWQISVSWVLMDPAWKVFAQTIKLVKGINNNKHFEWASISTFKKSVNPDENIWWMLAPINLRFSYKK